MIFINHTKNKLSNGLQEEKLTYIENNVNNLACLFFRVISQKCANLTDV